MAHAATINQLTDNLVRSIVSSDHDSIPIDQIRENAVKSLRSSSHARTNQFDIHSRLIGLVEKFAVLNRDDLSEALQFRLSLLPVESKWLPEILSLLLHLSERPVEKANVETLDTLPHRIADASSTLAWEELTADAPIDHDGLWDDVERGYHSSGDDATVDEEHDSDATTSTQATSIAEYNVLAQARSFIVPLDDSALEEVKCLREHMSERSGGIAVSELLLVRETLLMLHGLPTSLFVMNNSTGGVTAADGLQLQTSAGTTLRDITMQFAAIGSAINALRLWVRTEQGVAYIQSCQAATQVCLSRFGKQLADLEQRYLSKTADVVVSIVGVRSAVERAAKPLVRLGRIVQTPSPQEPHGLLNGLYDAACASELSGDLTTFTVLLPVFLAGLKTYLRSISCWIMSGTCDTNDETSLVIDRDPACDLGNFWHDRYAMKTFADGQPNVPILLQPRASRIFALGKSQAFLKALKTPPEDDGRDFSTVLPDFDSVVEPIKRTGLRPFAEILEETLSAWLITTAEDSTPALRRALFDSHGLLKSYASLTAIFCSENGRAFQDFAETVFWSMDHAPKAWRNEFLLSELANNTLSASSPTAVDTTLSIRIVEADALALSSIQQLQCLTLETILPWPVQNITRARSPTTYAKAFVLLLQIYRAKSLLRSHFFDLRPSETPRALTIALGLRQRLSTTIEILHAHITTTSSISNKLLLRETQEADDIDAMVAVWSKHDRQLETSLLLSVRPLREAVLTSLELCERFANTWARLVASPPEDDEDNEQDIDSAGPPLESFALLEEEANKQLSFLIAGLRGISRAGGSTALEMLAERLEWIAQ